MVELTLKFLGAVATIAVCMISTALECKKHNMKSTTNVLFQKGSMI
jgi:hypothetical protein